MTKQLARIEGVYFSISGHTLGLSDKKLEPMLQQASRAEPKAAAHDHSCVDQRCMLDFSRGILSNLLGVHPAAGGWRSMSSVHGLQ